MVNIMLMLYFCGILKFSETISISSQLILGDDVMKNYNICIICKTVTFYLINKIEILLSLYIRLYILPDNNININYDGINQHKILFFLFII